MLACGLLRRLDAELPEMMVGVQVDQSAPLPGGEGTKRRMRAPFSCWLPAASHEARQGSLPGRRSLSQLSGLVCWNSGLVGNFPLGQGNA